MERAGFATSRRGPRRGPRWMREPGRGSALPSRRSDRARTLPAPMSRGTVMLAVRLPPAPVWNGKVWMVLRSWISPSWFAGMCIAVTTTVPPATTVDGDRETDGLGFIARYPAPPTMSRARRTAAAASMPVRGPGPLRCSMFGSILTVSVGICIFVYLAFATVLAATGTTCAGICDAGVVKNVVTTQLPLTVVLGRTG